MQVNKRAISRGFPTSAESAVSSIRQTFGQSNFPILLTGGAFCSSMQAGRIIVANFMLHFYRSCFILLYAQYYCIGKNIPKSAFECRTWAWFILQCILGCMWRMPCCVAFDFMFRNSCHAIRNGFITGHVLPTLFIFWVGWSSVSNRWGSRFLCISYVVPVFSEIAFSCRSCLLPRQLVLPYASLFWLLFKK